MKKFCTTFGQLILVTLASFIFVGTVVFTIILAQSREDASLLAKRIAAPFIAFGYGYGLFVFCGGCCFGINDVVFYFWSGFMQIGFVALLAVTFGMDWNENHKILLSCACVGVYFFIYFGSLFYWKYTTDDNESKVVYHPLQLKDFCNAEPRIYACIDSSRVSKFQYSHQIDITDLNQLSRANKLDWFMLKFEVKFDDTETEYMYWRHEKREFPNEYEYGKVKRIVDVNGRRENVIIVNKISLRWKILWTISIMLLSLWILLIIFNYHIRRDCQIITICKVVSNKEIEVLDDTT